MTCPLPRVAPLVLLLVFFAGMPQTATGASRRPVLLEGKTQLFLRVLTRPQAVIYKTRGDSDVVQSNLPAFRPLYVYTAPSAADRASQQGWYEVGSDDRGTVLGWMQGKDLFEWKQTICLGYSIPVNRQPVLFFKDSQQLVGLATSAPDARASKAKALYDDIKSHHIPADFPIVSMEPKNYIDIEQQLYLLPILEAKPLQFNQAREGRLLKIASVVAAGDDARTASRIDSGDADYLHEAQRGPQDVDRNRLRQMKMDFVWVFDTTLSTQPYIDAAVAVAEEASKKIAASGANIRFGVWGYRCPVRDAPGIAYDTQNYTSSLQPIDAFKQTLASVRAATISSGDWEEDVFTGVRDAVAKTAWRDGAIRVLFLVGDAPGHGPGEKKTASNFDASQVRALADTNRVSIAACYVDSPQGRRYQAKGHRQFSSMSANPGTSGPDFESVDAASLQKIGERALRLTSIGVAQLQSAARGELPPLLTSAPQNADEQTMRAAIVEWIGGAEQTRAPRDVVGWVTDKDLIEPHIPSLNVKLLVTKRQLSALTEALSQIVSAAENGTIQSSGILSEIQNTAGWQARNPEQLSRQTDEAQRIRATKELLEGLPYKSRAMEWTVEAWQNNTSPDERDSFLNDLRGKIAYYQSLGASPDRWGKINPTDDPDDAVLMLDMTQLP